MTENNNKLEVIEIARRYLLQQKDIYGNELWGNFNFDNSHRESKRIKYSSLEEMYNSIKDCQKCRLGSMRNKLVFGKGAKDAKLMLIGEAPGRDEDLKGEPFVGRAGQLLTKILNAIKLDREEVYITNILKCRPPSNRNPLENEMEMCLPYLCEQLKLIKPKIILCLGLVSANCLLQVKMSIKELRNKVYDYQGIKMLVTYHPAALLRNPQFKKPTWEDVQFVRQLYNEE